MVIKITTEMLDRYGKGHSETACASLRKLLAGATDEPIELHAYEVNQARALRIQARSIDQQAMEIESRGPMPVEVDDDA